MNIGAGRVVYQDYTRIEHAIQTGAFFSNPVLTRAVETARKNGMRVAGYGASGRANTIIQFCGITRDHVEFMIDDASAKWGYCTPGSHIEIRSRESLSTDRPDYLLVFAWAYLNEIAKNCKEYLDQGGKLLTPLPEVRLVSHPKSA